MKFTCECIGGGSDRNRTLPELPIFIIRECVLACLALCQTPETTIVVRVRRARVGLKVGKSSSNLPATELILFTGVIKRIHTP